MLLKVFTNQAFLWVVFGIMLVVSGAIAGVGIGGMLLPQTGNGEIPEKAVTINPELASFQWQAILHCLAAYLALIPMLHRKMKDDGSCFRFARKRQTIADMVFYSTVVLGFITAMAAPIVLQIHYLAPKESNESQPMPEEDQLVIYQAAATGLNFASAVLSTAAAGMLAAKVITD